MGRRAERERRVERVEPALGGEARPFLQLVSRWERVLLEAFLQEAILQEPHEHPLVGTGLNAFVVAQHVRTAEPFTMIRSTLYLLAGVHAVPTSKSVGRMTTLRLF